MVIFFLILGLVALIVGAELLVRGASRLAAAVGVSPLVIGLTVVAFGTSAPEFAVSVNAALSGQAAITIGNVIGSNIFNVLFILGLAALITPLVVSQQLVRLDVPLMIAVSLLTWLWVADGNLSRLEGALLFGGLLAYTGFLIYESRRENAEIQAEYAQEFSGKDKGTWGWLLNLGLLVGGLGLLVLGSRWLVESAVSIAQSLGVSELLIGLTIIAAGTSMPEVVTSVVASLRGERDIAVGNVVGSNIFNLLGVLGLAGIIAPQGIAVDPAIVLFDFPVMAAVALVCLPIFTGGTIGRLEGGLLFGYYLMYTVYLILSALQHGALETFNAAMLYFAMPLTLVTFVVLLVQRSAKGKQPAAS